MTERAKQLPAVYEPSVWSITRAVDEVTRLTRERARMVADLNELAAMWAKRADATSAPLSHGYADCQSQLDELLERYTP